MLKKVYIGSANPVKIESVKSAFHIVFSHEKFDFIGVPAHSGVSHQPLGDKETLQGAMNRADFIFKNHSDGNFWIGIEGGVETINKQMHAFAWIIVKGQSYTSKSRTATFPLPEKLKELVEKGLELGDADDITFNRTNSKHHDGTVGLLTEGIIDRKKYYEHAVILALIPFKNKYIYA